MKKWELKFTVNGKLTVQVVNAYYLNDAKKLILAQYQGAKISFRSSKEIK